MKKHLSALILQIGVFFNLFSQDYDIQWMQAPVPMSIMDFRNDTIEFHFIDSSITAFITTGNICDKAGNFLFFTNGIYVRDRAGNKMPHGDSLSFYNPGRYSNIYANGAPQDQGVLILPKPNSDSLYYLFHYVPTDTTFMAPPNYVNYDPLFFYYSIVDITASGGFGDIVKKNVRLPVDSLMCSSRLTATKHGNGRDWWVIRHGDRDNKYIKFLVTQDTILGPYYQRIGPDFNYNGLTRDFYGGSVFNQTGDRMATGNGYGPLVVLDFDRCSGEFSNPLELSIHLEDTTSFIGVFGLAFSPSGRFLYAHDIFGLNQFDLWATHPNDSIRIHSVDESTDFAWMHTMRLAPNGKIYISTWNGGLKALHVINHPDSLGLTCDFQYGGQACITLNTNNLPNMVNYRLGRLKGSGCDTLPNLTITGAVSNASCHGACDGAIQISHTGGLQPPFYYKWSNDSTSKNLSSRCAGIYTVTVTDMWDTSIVSFTITQPDSLFITIDSITSDNGSNNGAVAISIAGGTPPYTFQWSNTDTTEDINQLSFGTYSVNITDANGCTTSLEDVTVQFFDALFEQEKEKINIYPNPVSQTLHVSLVPQYTLQLITIVDIAGKEILQTRETTISVEDLSQGVYFVKMRFEKGKNAVRKIVVQP